jgi:benzil reductase ((S)-benzoin forming)
MAFMKLLIITGGSKGLGKALVEQYRSQGYIIAEFSRTAPYPFSTYADFSTPDSMLACIREPLAKLAAQEWDEILVISNAATLSPMGPVARKDARDVMRNIHINVTSSIVFIGEVIRLFQDHASRKIIAGISSGAANKAYAGWSLYCAVKAALESFIRTVAVEQDDENHPFETVNLDPGVMDTEMQTLIRSADRDDFPTVDYFIQRKENGELRTPEQIASGIVDILFQHEFSSGERIAVREFIG